MTSYRDLTGNMELLEAVTTPRTVLEVYECTHCGYHLGVDSTYLEQIGDVHGYCPGCMRNFIIEGDEQ